MFAEYKYPPHENTYPMTMKKISFCVTCRNRLWQIKETLFENLACLEDDSEISLVDYGSSDGLSDWVWSNFTSEIKNGRLIFFEVTNDVFWSSPKAKNLAHRVSTGGYLFNLDADNFVTKTDFKYIREAIRLKLPCHQWSDIWEDGSFGRIGMPRDLFFKLGGYDEATLPMGGHDIDQLNRIRALGIRLVKFPAPSKEAIQNDIDHKISEVTINNFQDSTSVFAAMNRVNVASSNLRLQLQGPVLKGGYASFKGLLNRKPVIINGFDDIDKIV